MYPLLKIIGNILEKICDKYNVQLILDECYCGLGAGGKENLLL